MTVFLGGTCNDSEWREELIAMLNVAYFNPVVDDWTMECRAEEVRQRESCEICLYVITPAMKGVYSIAEVVDDSNKRPWKTVFAVLQVDFSGSFSEGELRSLGAVKDMVHKNGAKVLESLEQVADHCNRIGHNWKS